MRNRRIVGLMLIIVLCFSAIGTPKAEAMNNESAAMLAGAIAILGGPILRSITEHMDRPGVYEEPVRTRIIYRAVPMYRRHDPCYRPRTAYERGWCTEMKRIQREREEYEYQRGRDDARRYFYGY